MEKESFESEKVAEVMNKDFVNIKVDREERPDVDKMYMNFVQVKEFLAIEEWFGLLELPSNTIEFKTGHIRTWWMANECVDDT